MEFRFQIPQEKKTAGRFVYLFNRIASDVFKYIYLAFLILILGNLMKVDSEKRVDFNKFRKIYLNISYNKSI